MDYRVGGFGRVIVMKLDEGDDVYACVHDVARKEDIRCAMVTMVGGFRAARVVVGPKEPRGKIEPAFRAFDDAREVVGVGTLFWDEAGPMMHLHAGIGRGDEVMVGCPRGGATTFCVLEVTIAEIVGVEAERRVDPAFGVKLLGFGR